MYHPLSDLKSFYGRYVTKKEKAIPLETAYELESQYYEESRNKDIPQGEIKRAHIELDNLGSPRNQKNTKFPLDLAGRIRCLLKK